MKQSRILLVDDDTELVRVLRAALEDAAFTVVFVHLGKEAIKWVESQAVSAVILDVGLPDMSGFDVCRELRKLNANVPILFLTSKGDEVDRVTGFALGADDYILKPFSIRELVFRLKAILRRSEMMATNEETGKESSMLTVADIRVDPAKRRAYLRNEELVLTALEFDLLLFFVENPGRPYSREQLMQQIWAVNSSSFAPTVTTQISRLRKKIEPDPANPTYIRTQYGVGYRFVDPDLDELS